MLHSSVVLLIEDSQPCYNITQYSWFLYTIQSRHCAHCSEVLKKMGRGVMRPLAKGYQKKLESTKPDQTVWVRRRRDWHHLSSAHVDKSKQPHLREWATQTKIPSPGVSKRSAAGGRWSTKIAPGLTLVRESGHGLTREPGEWFYPIMWARLQSLLTICAGFHQNQGTNRTSRWLWYNLRDCPFPIVSKGWQSSGCVSWRPVGLRIYFADAGAAPHPKLLANWGPHGKLRGHHPACSLTHPRTHQLISSSRRPWNCSSSLCPMLLENNSLLP